MTDFKAFFGILKSKFFIICVYIGIFAVIMSISSNVGNGEGGIDYSAYDFDIAVIDYDNSPLSKAITSYIKENMSLIDIIETEEGMEDALFERVVEYILIIPNNYQSDILNGNNPVLESKKVPDAYGAKFAESVIRQYIDTFYIYQKQYDGLNEESISKVINMTDASVMKKTDVAVKHESISKEKENLAETFNFGAYVILACVIWVVSEVLAIFFEKNIARRSAVSPITQYQQNKSIIAYSFLCMLIAWIIIMLVCVLTLGKSMLNIQGMLMSVNMFLISLIALACGFAVSVIFQTKNARNAAANVIALGFSFISGVFVPLSMLSTEVKSIAAFLPTYWYTKANNTIAELTKFSLTKSGDVLMCFGIEMLFFITIISVGMVSKRQMQKD